MADQQPTHTRPPTATSGLGLAVGAAALITAITGIAFWLSYHHLHDVAASNGLGVDPARAWAWPAVLDLFYLAGELLILRASYLRTVDPWAIALTAIGALGSIGLNVAGVGTGAGFLEYIVAAVPPVAALLAFGALMRQLHLWFARRPAAAPQPVPAVVTVERAEQPPIPPKPAQAPQLQAAPHRPTPPPAPIVYQDPRCAVVRPLYDTGTRPSTSAIRTALIAAGHGRVSDGTIRGVIRAEIEQHEPHLKTLPGALPPAVGQNP
ncbi:DUF2637 domain-containing protein [Streptomyces sp. PD-S100-1]|uniref:DUF2637 domain-containing protein n=1 Tax=Streptomyces sp. PD-S100-1 TaxID=3394351 RepID=UPI0039BC53EE